MPFHSSVLTNFKLYYQNSLNYSGQSWSDKHTYQTSLNLILNALARAQAPEAFPFFFFHGFPPSQPLMLGLGAASWLGGHTHQAHARAARAPQQYYYSRLPRCTLTIFFQRNTSSSFSFAFSVKKQQLRTNSQQFDEIFWTVKRRCAKNFVLCISCLPPKGYLCGAPRYTEIISWFLFFSVCRSKHTSETVQQYGLFVRNGGEICK